MKTVFYRFSLSEHKQLLNGKLSSDLREKLSNGLKLLEKAELEERKKPGRKPISASTEDQIMRYYRDGMSYRKIADDLRVSHTTVMRTVRKLVKTKEK